MTLLPHTWSCLQLYISHICIYVIGCMHTNTHTHIHTCIHTYIYFRQITEDEEHIDLHTSLMPWIEIIHSSTLTNFTQWFIHKYVKQNFEKTQNEKKGNKHWGIHILLPEWRQRTPLLSTLDQCQEKSDQYQVNRVPPRLHRQHNAKEHHLQNWTSAYICCFTN